MPESYAQKLRERAARCFPGGVLHHFTAIPERPTIVITRGKGSRMWDSEGKEYIDYYLGSASLTLGHAHPEVIEAVTRQIENGTQFFELNPPAIDLAELIIEAVPSAEQVKYAMSGTEAVLAAVRAARAHTGRSKIVKFEGAYHGSHDWMMWGTYPEKPFSYPSAPPDSPGIPAELQSLVLVAPYNDAQAFEQIVRENSDDLAAVLAEPLLGNIKPKPGFLETVRHVTQDAGIPLIFDEVVTGFRLAFGGAQEYYGVTPDMTALGKSLGGGFPIGALAGRTELMNRFAPALVASGEAVRHVGTLSGNPVSCIAGAVTLSILKKPGTYERLHELGRRLADGLRGIGKRLGIPAFIMNEGPTVDIWFTDRDVSVYRDNWSANRQRGRLFKLGLLDRGIWSPPGFKMFISLSHTDADIDRTLEMAEASMRDLA